MLTVKEIRDHLQSGQQKNAISQAIEQEQRLQFHSETSLSHYTASPALNSFFRFVKSLLPDDKFRTFVTLFRFPVRTVSLTDEIYTTLGKIFDGRNPVFDYRFANTDDLKDWNEYSKGNLKTWATKGFETMKTAINSIVIVDLPAEQSSDKPEPYFYFLSLSDVINFKSDADGLGFEWIIFKQGKDKVAVFDDTSFRVFETVDGSHRDIKSEPVVENFHELNYCPARFFWSTPVRYSEPIVKKSPLSNQLGQLDMLLFFDVSNEHLNLYGRYPIYSAFAADCDFVNDATGEYCESGLLKNKEGLYLIDGVKPKSCPACQNRRLDGAGSFIEIDPPSEMNDKADLRNPVQITSIDRTSLEYNNEDIAKRKLEIFSQVTGYKGMSINDKAVNEKQVTAIFESLETALQEPQRNFEQVMTWTDSTICSLRYGKESFQGCSVSLGTEHYIMTPSQILGLYEQAKEMSVSTSTLDLLEDRYFETEYKNNPNLLNRQKVLNNLDPFRHRSMDEVSKMYQNGEISYSDYMIKSNFSSLIMRFERENIPVEMFGVNVSFDAKIKAIRQALIQYANEMHPKELTISE